MRRFSNPTRPEVAFHPVAFHPIACDPVAFHPVACDRIACDRIACHLPALSSHLRRANPGAP